MVLRRMWGEWKAESVTERRSRVQSESLKLPPKSNCGKEKSISGYPRISISPATLNKVRHAATEKAMLYLVNINGSCCVWHTGGERALRGFGIKINKHKGHTWYADEQGRALWALWVWQCHWASNDPARRLPRAPFKDVIRGAAGAGGGSLWNAQIRLKLENCHRKIHLGSFDKTTRQEVQGKRGRTGGRGRAILPASAHVWSCWAEWGDRGAWAAQDLWHLLRGSLNSSRDGRGRVTAKRRKSHQIYLNAHKSCKQLHTHTHIQIQLKRYN